MTGAGVSLRAASQHYVGKTCMTTYTAHVCSGILYMPSAFLHRTYTPLPTLPTRAPLIDGRGRGVPTPVRAFVVTYDCSW